MILMCGFLPSPYLRDCSAHTSCSVYLAMPLLRDVLVSLTYLSFALPVVTYAFPVCSGSLNLTVLCLAVLFDMFAVALVDELIGDDLVGCWISFLIKVHVVHCSVRILV